MTFLRSIIITLIISVGFAYGLRNVFGFWETLILAFIIQFIIAFVYSSFKINKVQQLTGEFEQEIQQLLELSEVNIACPCGNYTYNTNIFLNLEETYVCEKCSNEFRVEITLTPTLLTQPIYTESNALVTGKIEQELQANDDVEITSEYAEGTQL
jgi:hypothetical protein